MRCNDSLCPSHDDDDEDIGGWRKQIEHGQKIKMTDVAFWTRSTKFPDGDYFDWFEEDTISYPWRPSSSQ